MSTEVVAKLAVGIGCILVAIIHYYQGHGDD